MINKRKRQKKNRKKELKVMIEATDIEIIETEEVIIGEGETTEGEAIIGVEVNIEDVVGLIEIKVMEMGGIMIIKMKQEEDIREEKVDIAIIMIIVIIGEDD